MIEEEQYRYTISIVFVPKLVDMYIVFEEKLYICSVYKINEKN